MHHPAKLCLQLNANTLNCNDHPKSQSLPQLPSSLGIRRCYNSGLHPRPLEVSCGFFDLAGARESLQGSCLCYLSTQRFLSLASFLKLPWAMTACLESELLLAFLV